MAVGLGGLAFGVIQVIQGTVAAFEPRPVVSLIFAVAVGLIGVTAERKRHLSVQRRALTSWLHAWPLLSISAV
jgi:hypothetical protein